MKKDMGFLFIVFVLYVGIRLVPFFSTFDNTSRFFLADSYQYNLLGVNIAQHGYYTPNGGEPGLSRAPGYPVYLAAVYKIFGVKPAIALFLQIVLSGLIPLFLFMNAELLFSKRVARIASVLSIVEPVSIIYANMLLSETLFVVFLLLSTYFFIKSLKNKNTTALFVSAITAGIGAYFRPVILYLPLAYAFMYISVSWLSFKDRIKYALSIVLITGLTILPWITRNYIVDRYKGFCSIQDLSLYNYRAAGVIADIEHLPLGEVQDRLKQAVPPGLSLANKYQFLRDKAISVIIRHPYAYLKVMMKGSVIMLLSPERYAVFKLADIKPRVLDVMWKGHSIHQALNMLMSDPVVVSSVVLYQLLFTIIIGLLIAIGMLIIAGEGFIKELLIMLFIIAYFVAVSAGPEAEPRFRLPVLPYMLIIAAFALSSLFTSVASKHYKKRIK
ncbi:MAG: glycosyltransferase family 39 protein [Deltaproteobacteria bacterium]|nr:glycosyltransferase family 39 protein [Deltaproteobacteria bacterium]